MLPYQRYEERSFCECLPRQNGYRTLEICQHNIGRLGIHIEIKFRSYSSRVSDSQIVAAHQVNALDERCEILVGFNGQGNIGQGSDANKCYLIWELQSRRFVY